MGSPLDEQILVFIEFENRACIIFEKEIEPHIEKKDFNSMLTGLQHIKEKFDAIRKMNFEEMVVIVRGYESAGRQCNRLQSPERVISPQGSQEIEEEIDEPEAETPKRKKSKKQAPKKKEKLDVKALLTSWEKDITMEGLINSDIQTQIPIPMTSAELKLMMGAAILKQGEGKVIKNQQAYGLGMAFQVGKASLKELNIRYPFEAWVEANCEKKYEKSWINRLINFYEFARVNYIFNNLQS